MGSKRKRGIRRWLWRGSLGGMGCVVGIGIGLYLGRVQIAQLLTDRALRQNGLEDCRLQWKRLDPKACEIADIKFATDSFTLEIDRLRIVYDLGEAWENQEIESANINGLHLYYDLTGPSTLDYEQLDSTIKEGIPFQLDSIVVNNATLDLLTDIGRFAYSTSASIEKRDSNRIQGKAIVESESESVELQLSTGDRIDFHATLKIPQISNALSKYQSNWMEKIGLANSPDITLADLSLEASGSFHGISPELIQVSFQTGPISYASQGLELGSNPISGNFDFEEEEIRNLHLKTQFDKIAFGEYHLSNFPLQLSSTNLHDPHLEIGRATFKSESGESAEFSALVDSRFNENFELEGYEFDLSLHSLEGNEFEFAPLRVKGSGSLESAKLECETIKLVSHPFVQFEDLQVGASGLDSESPSIELSTRIQNPIESEVLKLGPWIAEGTFHPSSEPQTAEIKLIPAGDEFAVSTPNFNAMGTASLSIEVKHWKESDKIAGKIGFTTENLNASNSDWSLSQGSVKLGLDTSPISITETLSKTGSPIDLAKFLLPQLQYELAVGGNQLDGPADSQFQWFSGNVTSKDSVKDKPLQAALSLSVGIGRFPPEEFQQLNWQTSISGNLSEVSLDSAAKLLFEGVEVSLNSNQNLEYDQRSLSSIGKYEITGIELESSDILSRHIEDLDGSVVSGKLSLNGSTEAENGNWDASAKLQLAEGHFGFPSQELMVDGISANIAVDSLTSLGTPPSQSISAKSIDFGDLQANNFHAAFSLPSNEEISIEGVSLETFDGHVYLEPFELSFDDPNANLLVKFEELSIAPAIAMVDFFQGRITGRLNGSLPISLENGLPELGEGFLELDPNHKATFSYNAEGFFTDDDDGTESKKSIGDKTLEKLGLEPNALLEDALGNLDITRLRVDLFNQDMPLTPMKIQLAGIADTGKAKIPLNITTNVNGTVAELLNFLTRLDSLGMIAPEQTEADQAVSF
ncbi:MAG TPA: hypothetical protein DIV79_15565 [Opitutae bacterium]|nr:hypothetical protein [Opitutaceae bacterium]HCR31422.1 hypothetical protein [Opitutae bacterium]